MSELLIIIAVWLVSGILCFYLQKLSHDSRINTMPLKACLLLGCVGFIMLAMRVYHSKDH